MFDGKKMFSLRKGVYKLKNKQTNKKRNTIADHEITYVGGKKK